MTQEKNMIVALNRGVVSPLGLARIDLERMSYAAEEQTNIMPRVLGSAMLRPGMEYISAVHQDASNNYLPTALVPFVFSEDETAIIEFTGRILTETGNVRVLVDDEVISRPSVTAQTTNGTFIDDIGDWTDSDESGATSKWTDSGNAFFDYMDLLGDGTNAAIREQEVTVTETGTEHALELTVNIGPVVLRVGSTAGAEDYIAETELDPGEHSLSFTPTGNFHVHLSNRRPYTVRLQRCEVASSGEMLFSTLFADSDLQFIRYAQSGDIVFIACKDHQQQKIERRGERSWSRTVYESLNGPWQNINITEISLTPSAIEGDITITASKAIFRSNHVGGMLRVNSIGQNVSESITAEDTFTDPIRVAGIDDSRIFNIVVSGTFTATVTVQYSVGEPGSWVDLATTYTSPTTTTHDDGLDNQIIYYRIGVKSGDFSSGTAVVSLSIASGAITGIMRITGYTSGTVVSGYTVKAFGGTDASKDWWESDWSGFRGWPSAVGFHEGRLFWAGQDKIWGSISDAYYDFDDFFEGDAGPISRNIGFGPIQDIFWLLPLERLLMGTAKNSKNIAPAVIDGNNVISARSSGFDEPLTPTNFNLKAITPVGIFVDRSGQRIFSLEFDGIDYKSNDMNLVTPDLNVSGIVKIAIQFKPDVRIHCIRSDGKAGVLVFDRAEDIAAWIEVETDGTIEDVTVLPGPEEDQVYYVVQRDINSEEARFIEKWALESECQGDTLNKQADAFLEYSGASTTSISGLDHLEGETVYIWGNGKNLGTKTVSSGSISGLSEAVTSAIVGLTYRGRFKGSKLGSLYRGGLNLKRRIAQLGLVLRNTHHQGIRYGPSFDKMYDLPSVIADKSVTADTVFSEFDHDLFAAGGDWSADARLHFEMNAPKPATIQAITMVVDA